MLIYYTQNNFSSKKINVLLWKYNHGVYQLNMPSCSDKFQNKGMANWLASKLAEHSNFRNTNYRRIELDQLKTIIYQASYFSKINRLAWSFFQFQFWIFVSHHTCDVSLIWLCSSWRDNGGERNEPSLKGLALSLLPGTSAAAMADDKDLVWNVAFQDPVPEHCHCNGRSSRGWRGSQVFPRHCCCLNHCQERTEGVSSLVQLTVQTRGELLSK